MLGKYAAEAHFARCLPGDQLVDFALSIVTAVFGGASTGIRGELLLGPSMLIAASQLLGASQHVQ